MNDTIRIQGARENNLKNVNLTIPRDKLVVFTGLSGSGKSSLAFDTIYAQFRAKLQIQERRRGILYFLLADGHYHDNTKCPL